MAKCKPAIWIAVFLVITASPAFTYFLMGQSIDSENYENRNMAVKPVLTVENYDSFPNEYETYYNDNIPFRNQLIRFHNSIDYFIFKQSANENVEIGKNGWLFYYVSDTETNPIGQALGYWHFTPEQLQTIADNLLSTKRVLESQGIEFVLFIAPNKETIYTEELPDYYKVRDSYTGTDQLIDYLRENTDIRVVYPKQELLEAKEEYTNILLYRKLDTHWNYAGAYLGAASLAKELDITMPPLNEVNLESTVYSNGDLANMLNIVIENGDVDYDVSGINDLNTINEKWDFFGEFLYHTDGADPRKLFVRRDSFSSAMAPSLATQFEDSLWVHADSFDQQQIFDYGADIFIYETAERYATGLEIGLDNFRVSFVSSSVEDADDKTKKITLKPAISKVDLQFVSIFKKADGAENLETIQEMKPFNEELCLNVPEDESGEIYTYIFTDESGEEILEEVTTGY